MPAGRPTKYRPEMCEQVVKLMGQGYSKRACAGALGICEERLYGWAKEHPEFSKALKDGETVCEQWYLSKGLEAMQGEIDGFNATAYVWLTKNVLKWRDRMEHTGKDGGPIETSTKVLNVNGV